MQRTCKITISSKGRFNLEKSWKSKFFVQMTREEFPNFGSRQFRNHFKNNEENMPGYVKREIQEFSHFVKVEPVG